MNLFCIPFSGGNAYSYSAFQKQLPGNIRFFNLELPGHGTRITEPLLYSIDEMTEDLFRQIEPELNGEYALFGHSLGALLAFTLTREIRSLGKPLPSLLFVSGQTAPSSVKPDNRYLLPDDQFIEILREMEGTPEELLAEKEFLDFYLPIVKADFQAIANYRYRYEPPLEVPVVVLLGRQEKVSADDAGRWQEETIKETEVFWFEGGHFFIYERTPEICKLIRERCLSFVKHD
ncbi:MAG: alpha/beta fold hydrolase [Prolixibacteraceae bacterium]|jgi:surfactin synthase thioesterase subunit|nr:alpha/beta fold hydrolase [Prolixibacteraceae bacterium]